MPHEQAIDYTAAKVEPIYPLLEGGESELNFMPGLTIVAGTVLGQVSSANVNEVQTLNFSGTWAAADTFTVTIAGIDGGTFSTTFTLSAVPSVTNVVLKAGLDALLHTAGYIGATVTIGGGPCPTDATVTFGGTAAGWNMPLMTVTEVTAGDGTVVIDATTPGVTINIWGAYLDGATDGRTVARAIAKYSFRTDNFGRVAYCAAADKPELGLYSPTAPGYFKGRFRTADLTGLDANGITDLGRLESGTAAAGILALV